MFKSIFPLRVLKSGSIEFLNCLSSPQCSQLAIGVPESIDLSGVGSINLCLQFLIMALPHGCY
ncbi:MAG: hypothetical protein CMF96_02760 [Candidatus Marinimicrobia bacterium]|nr:hypothetical protein [Candidatus Neomarinimicrobiota bacterium]